MTGFARRKERGAVAVETAFLLPVLLVGLMMLFEIARLALILIIGNLALESAMQGLRRDDDLRLTDDSIVADRVKERMLSASYGYLEASELEIEVVSYADFATFGAPLSGGGDSDGAEEEQTADEVLPVLSVEANMTQKWSTALPALLGLSDSFAYTYRQVLGNLYRPAAGS